MSKVSGGDIFAGFQWAVVKNKLLYEKSCIAYNSSEALQT